MIIDVKKGAAIRGKRGVNQGQRPVFQQPENEQSKANAKEEFRREKFDVPGTRRSMPKDDDQMQGIAQHGNGLPQERFARVTVSVPQRKFSVFQQTARFDKTDRNPPYQLRRSVASMP